MGQFWVSGYSNHDLTLIRGHRFITIKKTPGVESFARRANVVSSVGQPHLVRLVRRTVWTHFPMGWGAAVRDAAVNLTKSRNLLGPSSKAGVVCRALSTTATVVAANAGVAFPPKSSYLFQKLRTFGWQRSYLFHSIEWEKKQFPLWVRPLYSYVRVRAHARRADNVGVAQEPVAGAGHSFDSIRFNLIIRFIIYHFFSKRYERYHPKVRSF